MSDMTEAYSLLTQDQIDEIEECFAKADAAQKEFETWSQEAIDRTIQSVAQMVANTKKYIRLIRLQANIRLPTPAQLLIYLLTSTIILH